MANTVQISAAHTVSDGLGAKSLSRGFSFSQTGTKFFSEVQSIGTAVETLAVGDCANLKYVALCNPSTNTATVTCTMAAVILTPGDVAIFRPSSALVTLQATAAAVDLATQGSEA